MKWLYTLIGLVFLAGCGQGSDGVQEVSSASVTVDASRCPALVSAEIRASKGACDEAQTPEVSRSGNRVEVRLPVVTTEEVCIAIIEEYTEVVVLGEFDPGDYELVVEAKIEDFRAEFRVEATCEP